MSKCKTCGQVASTPIVLDARGFEVTVVDTFLWLTPIYRIIRNGLTMSSLGINNV